MGWWLILLFLVFGGRGWGGQGGGYGAGNVGGNEIYPWLNQNQTVNDGFRDQMLQNNVQGIQSGINGLSTQLCNCCCDMRQTVSDGFYGAEANANARQIANMNQAFGAQTAMMQGFNAQGTQTAELRSTVISENCADREALNSIGRDIIANQMAGTQRILDKLCDQELFAERRENDQLRQRLYMADLAASQTAQTAQLTASQNLAMNNLVNELRSCPIPCQPVYGSQPIFTCNNGNNGCGCGGNVFAN